MKNILPISLLFVNSLVFSTPELEFHWPSSTEFTVTETSLKNGKTSKLKYGMRSHVDDEGNHFFEWGEFEYIDLNGLPLDSPEVQNAIRQLKSTLDQLPGFVINKNGEFVDLTDYEKLVQSSIDMMLLSNPGEFEHAKKMRKMMNQPSFKNVVIQNIKNKYWDTWVGMWIGLEIEENMQLGGIIEEPLLEGQPPIEFEYIVSNLGENLNHSNSVHLIAEGKSIKNESNAMLAFMMNLAPDFENDPAYQTIKESTVSFKTKTELIADRSTLQPYSVLSEKETIIDDGIEPSTSKIISRFEFDWKNKPISRTKHSK